MGASSIAYDTIFYSDVEALSKYFPVMSHLSPATRILNENSGIDMKLQFKEI